MRLTTLAKLCCPFDKADLDLTIIGQRIDGNVTEGLLVCNTCDRRYPIVKGVPIMNPDEYREFKLEKPLIDRWQNRLKDKTQ